MPRDNDENNKERVSGPENELISFLTARSAVHNKEKIK
jgi:hypothetical protein